MIETDAPAEPPTHCSRCKQPLMVRRPGRELCVRCDPDGWPLPIGPDDPTGDAE